MTRVLALILVLAAALTSQETMDGNQLVRPEGYREWMFVGSNLNMGYSEGPAATESRFHNIYIQPEAYRQYAAISTSSAAAGLRWRKPSPSRKKPAGTATTSTRRPTTCSCNSIPSCER